MKRIVRLNESDLKRIVRRVLRENPIVDPCEQHVNTLTKLVGENKVPSSCLGSDMEQECMKDLMKMVTGSMDPVVIAAAKALAKCRKENNGMMF